MLSSPQPPMCVALVLADTIWRDPTSGKRSILGMFSTAHASRFPSRLRLAIYVALTDGRGNPEVEIRVVDADELLAEPVALVQATFDFSDPRVIVEMDANLHQVEFPGPGEYRVQVYCGGDFIIERGFFLLPSSDTSKEFGDE